MPSKTEGEFNPALLTELFQNLDEAQFSENDEVGILGDDPSELNTWYSDISTWIVAGVKRGVRAREWNEGHWEHQAHYWYLLHHIDFENLENAAEEDDLYLIKKHDE